jgi:hypothetical protein
VNRSGAISKNGLHDRAGCFSGRAASWDADTDSRASRAAALVKLRSTPFLHLLMARCLHAQALLSHHPYCAHGRLWHGGCRHHALCDVRRYRCSRQRASTGSMRPPLDALWIDCRQSAFLTPAHCRQTHPWHPIGVHRGLLFLRILAPVALDLGDEMQRIAWSASIIHLHDEIRQIFSRL